VVCRAAENATTRAKQNLLILLGAIAAQNPGLVCWQRLRLLQLVHLVFVSSLNYLGLLQELILVWLFSDFAFLRSASFFAGRCPLFLFLAC